MTDLSQSEYISNLGPDFYVGEGKHKRWSFQRIIDGPEQGGVVVSLVIDGEIHHSTVINQAGWESVLAHACKARHDGASFDAARRFHEAERHDWRRCTHCDGSDGNCEECAGTGFVLNHHGYATGGSISAEAAARIAAKIEANSP